MIKLLALFSFIHCHGAFLIKDKFTFCYDTEIIDFSKSCSSEIRQTELVEA